MPSAPFWHSFTLINVSSACWICESHCTVTCVIPHTILNITFIIILLLSCGDNYYQYAVLHYKCLHFCMDWSHTCWYPLCSFVPCTLMYTGNYSYCSYTWLHSYKDYSHKVKDLWSVKIFKSQLQEMQFCTYVYTHYNYLQCNLPGIGTVQACCSSPPQWLHKQHRKLNRFHFACGNIHTSSL